MPRLRPKRKEPTKVAPHTDIVYALSDVSKGGSFVRKGAPIRRNDPMVLERPDLFEVRYRLDQEVTTDA
jgi:hypothetical protein